MQTNRRAPSREGAIAGASWGDTVTGVIEELTVFDWCKVAVEAEAIMDLLHDEVSNRFCRNE